MSQRLVESIRFEDSDVFFGDRKLFTVPTTNSTMKNVRVLGLWDYEQPAEELEHFRLIIGTGACCHGHVYVVDYRKKDEQVSLDDIFMPGLNVNDLYVVEVQDYEKGINSHGAILVAGHGCTGQGAKIIGTDCSVFPLVTSEEMRQIAGNEHSRERFRIDKENGTMFLDYLRAGYRLKQGATRNPNLPSLLLDRNAEEWYVSERDLYGSIDVGPRLLQYGIDIAKQIADPEEKPFVRLRHSNS